MHTAVLVHGCHLQARRWDNIIWGDPGNGVLGRVPKGILEALKWDAKMIVFSTGASERDGLKEGEYIYHYGLERLEQLAPLTGMSVNRLRMWLQDVARLELTSVNTKTEVLASAQLAKNCGVERLVLVSSPTHIMRCHQAAISVCQTNPELRFLLKNLYATASDTSYADSVVDDVVILEPPHRGDRADVPIYKTAARLTSIRRSQDFDKVEEFNTAFGAFLDDWQERLG